ncbi:MAG: serine hydrolase, partial [Methyloligellaceae bacterium]
MKLRRPWLARTAAAVILCLLIGAAYALPKVIRIGAGHYAKMMCSGLFLSKRGVKALVDKEIAADLNGWLEEYVPVIDRARGTVDASLFGMGTTRAIYREGLGCTVLSGVSEDAVRRQLARPIRRHVADGPAGLWPEGDRVDLAALPPQIDRKRLAAAMREAFREPLRRRLKRTRAVVVVHKGRIVAEAYGQTFTAATPMMGWGLAQGAMNALVGILVKEGKLRLDARKLLPAWSDADDPKSRISLDHLMRMTSGLAFDQSDKALIGDLFPMLYT